MGRQEGDPTATHGFYFPYALIKIHLIFISTASDIQLPSCKSRQQFFSKLRYLRSTRCHPDSSNAARNHTVLTHQERMAEGEYISPVTAFLLHLLLQVPGTYLQWGSNAV